MRRTDRARAKDHFSFRRHLRHPSTARDTDADGAATFEDDAEGAGSCDHLEVRARQSRLQERDRAAAPRAPTSRELESTGAVLRGAVEVVIVWAPAEVGARVREQLRDRCRLANRLHVEGTVGAVKIVRASLVAFRFLEERQDVVKSPPGVSLAPPRDGWLPLECATDVLAAAQKVYFEGDASRMVDLGCRIAARRYTGPTGSRVRLISPDMLVGFGITNWPEWYRNNGKVWVTRRDSLALVVAFEGVRIGSPGFWSVMRGWFRGLLELCEVGRCKVDIRVATDGTTCDVRCAWER